MSFIVSVPSGVVDGPALLSTILSLVPFNGDAGWMSGALSGAAVSTVPAVTGSVTSTVRLSVCIGVLMSMFNAVSLPLVSLLWGGVL